MDEAIIKENRDQRLPYQVQSETNPAAGGEVNPAAKRIYRPEIRDVLRKGIGRRAITFLNDEYYIAYHKEEIKAGVSNSPILKRPHQDVIWDCDDRAIALMADMRWRFKGAPYGTILYYWWNGTEMQGHYENIFYDHVQKQIWLIEPKDGHWHNARKYWRVGKIEM
jgi:hypothetical protein